MFAKIATPDFGATLVKGQFNAPIYLDTPILIGAENWLLLDPILMRKGCYLMHIEPKRHKSGHYLGCTKQDFGTRLDKHFRSDKHGAKFPRFCAANGHKLYLVAVWPDADFHDELILKARRNHASYCPVCTGEKALPPAPVAYEEIAFMEPHEARAGWLLPSSSFVYSV